MARAQQRRPPPVAETGRSCWGSGQQDASAALLFTAGAAEVIAKSVAKAYTSNGATLSVLLYLRAFEDGDFASAWGIGAVLLVLVLAINLAARLAKTKLKQKQ